ncbi:2-octaprenyl-3-methyl-6-methoxy-1,4-benzoquinol hydroxylase [Leucothrix sargassi]|nr:2-octaprenyl-3-methyl-6-methoxy-1,4-benzoquinol hydroxylase [Leucothrix sargassi]
MDSKVQVFDVIIVGAGIVGATLAALLAKTQCKIAVVEPRLESDFEADSEFDLRVSAISRASQRALEQAGAWQSIVDKRAHAYDVMHVWDQGGSGEIRFDARDVGEPDLGFIIENRVIQSSLAEALRDNPRITFFCPAKLSRLTSQDDKQVVTLDTGEQLSARLVVGADGPQSPVRELTGLSVQREDYGQKGLVCVVKTEKHHQYTAWQRFLAGGPLAFLPLDNGYSSIVWSLPADLADRMLLLDESAFKQQLADAFEHKLGAVTEVSKRAAFPLVGSHAERYVMQGVALLGDAAHTIHPLAGQGVNLGIKDAVMLAEVLGALPSREWGSAKRLRQYERARKGDNMATLKAMEGFKLLFGHQSSIVKQARNTGLNVFNALPTIKQKIMHKAMGL